MITIDKNNLYTTRQKVFNKIKNSSTPLKILMALLMAGLTGITALIRIQLPFTPVPITGETFTVLTAGLILGKKYGALSQILLILIIPGILFISFLSGGNIGMEALGSSGAYHIGFIIAAYFIGYIAEDKSNRKFKKMVLFASIASFIIIYPPGLIGLELFYYFNQGILLTIPQLFMMGAVPFIMGDIIKVLAAASVSKIFLPKL